MNVPYYPEVYWVGRNLEFEDLGLWDESNFDEEDFEEYKIKKRNVFLTDSEIILISKESAIPEESGHFLHFVNSRFNYENLFPVDSFFLSAYVEALGFFTSKLIVPERKNIFGKYQDFLPLENVKRISDAKKYFRKIICLNEAEKDFGIYQQGYTLGEDLFNHYISGRISTKKINNLFCAKLEGFGSPTIKFLNLKYKFGRK